MNSDIEIQQTLFIWQKIHYFRSLNGSHFYISRRRMKKMANSHYSIKCQQKIRLFRVTFSDWSDTWPDINYFRQFVTVSESNVVGCTTIIYNAIWDSFLLNKLSCSLRQSMFLNLPIVYRQTSLYTLLEAWYTFSIFCFHPVTFVCKCQQIIMLFRVSKLVV